jgi:hypothetical protein
MRGGWVPLFREDFYRLTREEGPHATVLWVALLSDAAYEPTTVDTKHGKIPLRPGQLICSRRRLAERLRIAPSTVRNLLKRWSRIDRITLEPLLASKSDQRRDQLPTVVTICDWDTYRERVRGVDHDRDHFQHTNAAAPRPEEVKEKRTKTISRFPNKRKNDDLQATVRDANKWLAERTEIYAGSDGQARAADFESRFGFPLRELPEIEKRLRESREIISV